MNHNPSSGGKTLHPTPYTQWTHLSFDLHLLELGRESGHLEVEVRLVLGGARGPGAVHRRVRLRECDAQQVSGLAIDRVGFAALLQLPGEVPIVRPNKVSDSRYTETIKGLGFRVSVLGF